MKPPAILAAVTTLAVALFAAATLAPAPLKAQDITIGEPVTYSGLDNAQNLPPLKLKNCPAPKVPKQMRESDKYDYVIVLSRPAEAFERDLDSGFSVETKTPIYRPASAWKDLPIPHGYVYGLETSLYLGVACFDATNKWKWDPAFPDENDPRRAWVAVIFNPASASATAATASPRLLAVAPATAPAGVEVPPYSAQRKAWANVTVGASGEIKKVSVQRPPTASKPLRENVEAIRQVVLEKWKFAPARQNGVAVEATVRVPVLMLPAFPVGAPVPKHVALLKSLKQAGAAYPKSMEASGETGKVTLEFALDDKGRPQNPIVVLSSNAAFDKPALDAISKWRFAPPPPGKPDSLGNTYTKLADARWQYELNFAPPRMVTSRKTSYYMASRSSCSCGCGTFTSRLAPVRTTSTVTTVVPGTKTKGQNIPRPVLAPANVKTVTPVYPYELLTRNVTGSATVRISRNTGWPEECPDIIKNSYKNLGYALAAAARYYTIEPALWKGEPAPTTLTTKFDFTPANPDCQLTPRTLQLLADEKQNPEKIIPEDKLDAPLKFQGPPPLPPSSLYVDDELKGLTTIEFLVDETGRVHLPRIVQTQTPEVASILMQEISMRAYAPPLQNGRPVVARARETLNFAPPDPANPETRDSGD